MQKDNLQEQESMHAQNEEIIQEAAEEVVENVTEEQESPAVDEKDQKIEDLQNKNLRLQADFDNFRRRTSKEQTQLASFVTANVVGKFLSVLDNFERAEASFATKPDTESMKLGLEKIRRQFDQVLKELNVEEIKAQGEKFNPELHEAVMRGQNSEMEEDTVEMVFEKGYRISDRIVRHSKVKVVSND